MNRNNDLCKSLGTNVELCCTTTMHAMILILFLYERAIKNVSNHMLLFIFQVEMALEKAE